MKRQPFAPDAFTLGMFGLGLLLMVFPLTRIAGLVALICAVLYWLLMGLLKALRR